MSVEADLRTDLLAYAPLSALIGTKLAADKVDKAVTRPFIVFVVEREPHHTLDNTLQTTRYEFQFQCWADTRAEAEQVADALEAALAQSEAVEPGGIPVEARTTAHEPDLDLEAVNITCDVWKDAA